MFSTYFFRKYFLKITLWLGINYHQPNLLEQGRQGVQNDVIIGAKTFYLFFFFLRKNEEKWENCSCSFEPSPYLSPSFIDLKILTSSASHSQTQIALIPEKNVRGARFLPACSNLVIFIISLPILALGILLRYYVVHSNCTNYLLGPLLALGIFLYVVSLIWMIGSCCPATSMLCLYQCVTFLLILGLLVLHGSGREVGASGW